MLEKKYPNIKIKKVKKLLLFAILNYKKMKDYQDKALKSLSEISVKPSNKTTLIELSEYLFQRDV